MYTLDEINVILSDLDACGRGGDCRACSRGDHWSCLSVDTDAASLIRWLLSELQRYAGEQTQLGEEGGANA